MQAVEIYDSAKRPPPALEELLALFRYRDLVTQLIARSIKTRYKRSVLGIGWTMLNPLLMMVVLTVVFSSLFRFAIESFPAYVLTGLVLWNFFSQTTLAAMGEMVGGGSLFARIYVPKAVFAVSAVGTGLVNLAFALGPLLLIMLATGVPIRWTALFLPVPVVLAAAFTLGVALLLCTSAVYFPDVQPMYEVILFAWMYLTPIIYPLEVVPVQFAWLIRINPVYYLLEMFRLPLYAGVLPDGGTILLAALMAAGTLALGWIVFARKAHEYAYRA